MRKLINTYSDENQQMVVDPEIVSKAVQEADQFISLQLELRIMQVMLLK